MGTVSKGVRFLSQSLFRTVEFLLAFLILLVAGFGSWLVLTEPGSPEGSGVIVGLFLIAASASVLLAITTILHIGIDAVNILPD